MLVLSGKFWVTEAPTCSLIKIYLWYAGPSNTQAPRQEPILPGSKGRVSQSQHYWYFGRNNSLLWRSVLCMVAYLAAYLASILYISVAPPSCDKQKYLDIAKCSLMGQNPSWLTTIGQRMVLRTRKTHLKLNTNGLLCDRKHITGLLET